jgi:hypothetical protein
MVITHQSKPEFDNPARHSVCSFVFLLRVRQRSKLTAVLNQR